MSHKLKFKLIYNDPKTECLLIIKIYKFQNVTSALVFRGTFKCSKIDKYNIYKQV